MGRILTVVFVLSLATLACSLGGSEEPTVVPSPRPLNSFITPTSAFIVVTNTPTVTSAPATSTPFNNTSSNSGNVSTCTKRTDWYVYTVKSGDTLNAIARAVQSDAGTLQNANCLANPNSLFVGQVLYVPRLAIPTPSPVPATAVVPTATNVNVAYLGKVTFSEGTYLDGDNIQLTAGHTITLAYPESSASAHHVEFLLTTTDGQVSGLIGSDTNLGDGAAVEWTVPAGLTGNFVHANLYQDASTLTQTSLRTKAHTLTVATEGSIGLSHIVLDNEEGIITLQPGATITVTYIGARTELGRADFALFDPAIDGWTTLGVDNNLADGASVEWTVPYGLDGQHIFASTYDSGGTQAQMIMTDHAFFSITSPTDNGMPTIFPMLGSDNPDAVFLAGNSEVVVLWYEMPLQVEQIEFYFQSDAIGGMTESPTLLGTDTEWLDGAQLEWIVPDEIIGSIYAIATFSDESTIISNSVNVFSH